MKLVLLGIIHVTGTSRKAAVISILLRFQGAIAQNIGEDPPCASLFLEVGLDTAQCFLIFSSYKALLCWR